MSPLWPRFFLEGTLRSFSCAFDFKPQIASDLVAILYLALHQYRQDEVEHLIPTVSISRVLPLALTNWSNRNGTQKLLEVEDDRKLRVFMDKKMGNEVDASSLGDEWKGYVSMAISSLRI